jgi:hypothetical protein
MSKASTMKSKLGRGPADESAHKGPDRGAAASRVDPSVKIGPEGTYTMGAVPLARTMGKPRAYRKGA